MLRSSTSRMLLIVCYKCVVYDCPCFQDWVEVRVPSQMVVKELILEMAIGFEILSQLVFRSGIPHVMPWEDRHVCNMIRL